MDMPFQIVHNDITKMQTDAIVKGNERGLSPIAAPKEELIKVEGKSGRGLPK
jgi:hypothetical protein